MRRIDTDWFLIMSELLVNLAAAWFGAAFIVPNFTGFQIPWSVLLLLGDLGIGIIFLLVAFKLRKMSKRRKNG